MKKQLLLWALLGCSVSSALWAQSKKDLVKRLEALEAQNKQLAADNALYKGQIADMHAQIDILKNDVSKFKERLAQLPNFIPGPPPPPQINPVNGNPKNGLPPNTNVAVPPSPPDKFPSAEQIPSNPAAIQWAETTHDFGTVKEGTVVEHIYKFKNTSGVPLVIENAVGSCGCTVPEYPKRPIGPGESGEIVVKFNSAGKPGQQAKSVTITANTNPRQSTLVIQGKVDKP